ncbi:MAG: amidohydrolase family protein [Myxococcota bacterium]
MAGESPVQHGGDAAELPSFYAKRNCFYGASSASPVELRDRDVIGAERVLWGSDYPHYEGTSSLPKLAIRHTFHDVPEAEGRCSG